MHDRSVRWLTVAVRALLAITLTVFVANGVLRVFDFSQAPDFGEGPILATVERFDHEPISAQWLEGPVCTINPYGPVYYWVVRGAIHVLPWSHSLAPGRLVSLLATLSIAGLVAAVVRRRTQSIELALLSAVILLLSPIVHTWATPHRVDPLAVLLALMAYLTIDVKRWGIVVSACTVVLASLAKQSMAFAGLSLFLYLLLSKRRKEALVYAILVAGLGLGTWGYLDYRAGGYFLATAVKGHLSPMWPQQAFIYVYTFLATPLGLAAAITLAGRFVKNPAEIAESRFAVGFIVSTIASAMLACKEGASYAYFFEASVIGALVVGLHGLPVIWSVDRRRALAMCLLASLILLPPEVTALRRRGLNLRTKPYGAEPVAARLASEGPLLVLADGQYVDAVLYAGLTPLINDPFIFRHLVESKRLSPARVVQALERGEVPYLVLKRRIEGHRQQIGAISQKWPREVIDAIEKHYVLDWSDGDALFIYRYQAQ